MTETKERKNPDYTTSAVNLKNASILREFLLNRQVLVETQKELQAKLEATEIYRLIKDSGDVLADIDKSIKEAIEKEGSYQDVEAGMYAIKQRRESIIYKPELARQYLESKALSLVLVEAVDAKALDGLVKGGIVKPEMARQCGEIKETFAFIIK